ncbi:MAG: dihydroorotase [Bacteroidota bacterium]
MNLLIKSAKVTDPNSPFNNKVVDIRIVNGVIKEVKPGLSEGKGEKVFKVKNLHVSPGWFDMQANFRDPGYEYKEDLLSGCRAAAAGGFTGVAVMPSTLPPIHSKAEVEYVKNKTKGNAVDVYPIGTVSHNLEGKDLSEMYDMHLAGAIAFSDDKKAISDSGLLVRALLYVKNFGGLIITHCDDRKISLDGKMNEGKTSTRLGLKGIPALAEELMVARNIYLAEYAGARIHFSDISTKGSVELVREAKKRKLKVTASVNAYNLALDDSVLEGFDTNYKTNPPLRTQADINALKQGLADGTIDCITSDHAPEDVENKVVEFDHAAFGMTGLETAFALANMNRGKMSLAQLVEKMALNPRKILGLPVPKIRKGEKANLTLFDPDLGWTLEGNAVRSKSRNTPFMGKKLRGKALWIVK